MDIDAQRETRGGQTQKTAFYKPSRGVSEARRSSRIALQNCEAVNFCSAGTQSVVPSCGSPREIMHLIAPFSNSSFLKEREKFYSLW